MISSKESWSTSSVVATILLCNVKSLGNKIGPEDNTAARIKVFSNSRTFPGQE